MKRISLFCGHYGSGKTNLALNYALYLKKSGLEVSIADLDIVNPYFRTKDSEEELAKAGIELVSLPFAGSNVDLPSLPAAAYGLVQRKDRYAVLDIGGDDRGAYALGRYTPYILEENDYDMFFVLNLYRPLTRNAADALGVMREIEQAGGINFTGIINNSNLGPETTAEDVEKSYNEAEKLSALAELPIVFTSVEQSLSDKVRGENIFPLKIQKKLF